MKLHIGRLGSRTTLMCSYISCLTASVILAAGMIWSSALVVSKRQFGFPHFILLVDLLACAVFLGIFEVIATPKLIAFAPYLRSWCGKGVVYLLIGTLSLIWGEWPAYVAGSIVCVVGVGLLLLCFLLENSPEELILLEFVGSATPTPIIGKMPSGQIPIVNPPPQLVVAPLPSTSPPAVLSSTEV